ncbi:hypothetical protein KFE25_013655 [Diacronema lutheri]|uniref:FHA domain-containing protein n=2 Tax=Diacronema lutheri TaxID=2081491 RepID=A0A8J5XUC7_DIALT|nr:hypothetical protein KFE25_013655 [Diacronema lutheri]
MPLAGQLEGYDKTGALFLTFRLSTKREHYYVGRQADAVDVALEHESVSRRHAELTVTPVGVLITDLNAAHGTVVKGRRLRPHVPTPLEDGAEIRFAGSSRRFRFRSAASVAADAAVTGGSEAAWPGAGAGRAADVTAGGVADADAAVPPPSTRLFPPPPLNEPLCKAVLYLLRTQKRDGSSSYHLRPDGFVAVSDLVACSSLATYHATAQEIDDLERAAVVGGQRLFERRDEGALQLIRARAGHAPSVRVNPALQLRALTLAELAELGELVHATYFRCWNAIRHVGLDAMAPPSTRAVVCFASELPARGAVSRGMRERPQVLVCVDAQAMLLAGLRFTRDADGAVCCAGDDESGRIGLQYATRVLNASDGSELLDQDELDEERRRAAPDGLVVGPAPKPVTPAPRAQPANAPRARAGAPREERPGHNPYLAGGATGSDGEEEDGGGRAAHLARKKRARLNA